MCRWFQCLCEAWDWSLDICLPAGLWLGPCCCSWSVLASNPQEKRGVNGASARFSVMRELARIKHLRNIRSNTAVPPKRIA
jgi:hypothetical protein